MSLYDIDYEDYKDEGWATVNVRRGDVSCSYWPCNPSDTRVWNQELRNPREPHVIGIM